MKVQNFKTSVKPFSGNSIVNYHSNKSNTSQLTDNELGVKNEVC